MKEPVTGQLYVVRIGGQVKVGQTSRLVRRMGVYRTEARRYGVAFEQLYASDQHPDVVTVERIVLDRFRPFDQRHEYLVDVDPAEVVAFARDVVAGKRPEAPAQLDEDAEPWLTRQEAAEQLGVSLSTLTRYAAAGHLRTRRNPITKRATVCPADLRKLTHRPVGKAA